MNNSNQDEPPIEVRMSLATFEQQKSKSFRFGKEVGQEQIIRILHGYLGKTIKRDEIKIDFENSADEERLSVLLDKLTAWHQPEATFNGA